MSRLGGNICNSLLKLKHLHYLALDYNYFGGTQIPDFIGSLNNLEYLGLSGAGFGGVIPPRPGNLSKLQYLGIGGYGYYLSIKDIEWISWLSFLRFLCLTGVDLRMTSNWLQVMNQLSFLSELRLSGCGLYSIEPLPYANFSHLIVLDLSSNYFTSPILDLFLSTVPSLVELDASRNLLKAIPIALRNMSSLVNLPIEQLRKCKSLSILDIPNDSISGPIPESIGELSSLIYLDLSRNHLNGTLPVSLGNLSKPVALGISYNSFEGALSEAHFAILASLKAIFASSNTFTLQRNSDWIPPFQLTFMRMGDSHLGPQFPTWLQIQKNLTNLELYNAGICDPIPSCFSSFSQLSLPDLSQNHIHGNFPTLFQSLPKLSYLDLSQKQFDGNLPHLSFGAVFYHASNNFTGTLPSISFQVKALDLSRNSFNGSLASMLCQGTHKPSKLDTLDLSRNLLSGEIPSCWGNWRNLTAVKLGDNNLAGNIPSSIGFLSKLGLLGLHNNRFSGSLPPSLQNCKYLLSSDISGNEFSGSIPLWLGTSFSNLLDLLLHSNRFSGLIPFELCHLSLLHVLDLAHKYNNISGTIPNCLGNLSGMMATQTRADLHIVSPHTVDLSLELVVKDQRNEYNKLLLVKTMDLSDNSLSGEIPAELMNLHGFISLNLSRNKLQGKIPEKIHAMKLLESLDLSLNQLSGQIPQGVADLTFLSCLNLFYNNFSGPIPLGTQIQSFSSLSFVGNHELCGPPVSNNCSTDDASPSLPPKDDGNEDDEDDEWVDMKWFYMGIPFGSAVDFWAVLGSLALNKAWRYAYFLFLEGLEYKLFGCTLSEKFM
ncbi:receptor-like protein EIX2 [Malania oleifera]|uniref:receptor-like protein EIX2 n=1 Tax=Malania oleifera TaxID=397392 RepID=UPI0025AE6799|nr:receptor-like protein EIX2 [Malania oleifera]